MRSLILLIAVLPPLSLVAQDVPSAEKGSAEKGSAEKGSSEISTALGEKGKVDHENSSQTTDKKDQTPLPNLDEVDWAMKSFVKDGVVSGAVTLVARDGKVVHLSGVGLSDLESEEVMKPNAIFSIASMTKPITATALMMLEEEGKLSLDDKISKYIPAFAKLQLADGTVPEREITIRDALTHTSGLVGSQSVQGSLQESVEQLAVRPLAFQPGEKWKYSPGLNVCGRIVEIVSGKPFEEFLQERIFEPLQMNNTAFDLSKQQRRRLATLYGLAEDGKTLAAVDNRISDFAGSNGPSPSGGLVSTARDMFRFYAMVLAKGKFRGKRLLSPESVKKMTELQTGDLETGFTPGNGWGLGWCLVQDPQDVTGMLSSGTFGHGGAFGTQGWVDPNTRTIYVLMIQRTKMGNSDGSLIRKAFQQAAVDALSKTGE
ncbi:MAG: serine hydrolase domain-containing protein [Rubripirellula sp.]